MKGFSEEEVFLIIEKHTKWLMNEPGGEQANLKYADLAGLQ